MTLYPQKADTTKSAEDILNTFRNASAMHQHMPIIHQGNHKMLRASTVHSIRGESRTVEALKREVDDLNQQLKDATTKLESFKNLQEDYEHLLAQFSRLHPHASRSVM